MALVSMRQLLDHAAENSYGLPAFNVNNLEQMRAIMEAADQVNAPVIVQASAGARKYAGAPFLRHLILAAVEEFPHIPVVMHQDHGASPDVCQRSIQLGFSSVMMDGSLMEDGKTPSSYEYNVNATRTVVNFSHACGVSVEGEIGVLGNLETGEAGEEDGVGAVGKLSHDQMLTSVEDAVRFVKDTGVDALAIAVGTSHGAYKFTRPPTGDVLRIDRIKEIHQALPNTHIGEGHGVARLQLGAADGQEAGRGVAVGHDDGAARAPVGDQFAQEGEHHVLVVLPVVAHVDVARQLNGLDGAGRQEDDPLSGGVVELTGQGVGPNVPADDDGQEIGSGRTAVPGADHGVLLRGGSDSLAAGAPRRRRPRTGVRGLSRWAILGSNQ